MLFGRTVTTSIVIGLLSTLVGACGGLKPKDKGDANDPDTAEDVSEKDTSNGDASGAQEHSFDFTAKYKLRPVDVIIIRDANSRANQTINQRLNAALPLLSARLWNLATIVGSLHVGVFDHYYRDPIPDDATIYPNTATPIADAKTAALVLNAETLSAIDFDDALSARIQAAGSRPNGSPMPASVILALLEEYKKAKNGDVAGLFRKDAFVSILFIGNTLNPADPADAADVISAMSGFAGNYSISALVPDKTGCMVADVDPVVLTNPSLLPQRNLEIKLQEATSGLFGSLCDRTFTLFVDDFVLKATGTEYFAVELPGPIEKISRIVSEGGVEIKDYRFVKDSNKVEITTKVTAGTKFKIDAYVKGLDPEVIVSTDPGDETTPVTDEKLSPAETAFLKDVQPKLQANCGSCHAGRPYNTSGGYASALANKAEINRRINLPTTDTQRMPQNGVVIPSADKTIITNWSSK